MLIATVLMDAKKPGSSGWASVRDAQRIRLSGLGGGVARLHFSDGAFAMFTKDGSMGVPSGVIRVKAELVEVTERTRFFVDLEK